MVDARKRHRIASQRIKPAVVVPAHGLDGRLTAKHTTTSVRQRPAAKIGKPWRTIRGVHETRVPGTLQRRIGTIA
jgi:hypothetical protein